MEAQQSASAFCAGKHVHSGDGRHCGRNLPIRFRILGPVRLMRSCGCAFHPRSSIRRALLTSLLLQADQFVSVGQLQALLWDEPPASAHANLRSHLTRLRSDLEQVESGLRRRVERSRNGCSGYRIRVRPGELDLHAFTAAAGRGRVALLRGELEVAIGALEEADGAWDGLFGDNLPRTRWFAAHIAGINSARLTVCQDLFAAYLLAGRRDAVYLIERAVADGPYRERLWELLVAAHFLDGDPASALDAVSRCRKTFAEHLGIEAPPVVMLLQKAVLNRQTDEVRSWVATALRGPLR